MPTADLIVAFKEMDPDLAVIVPGHAGVHSQDQFLIGIEIRVAFRFRIGISHIAQALLFQSGNGKCRAFQFKGLSRVTVDSVPALLRFFVRSRRRQPIWDGKRGGQFGKFFQDNYSSGNPLRKKSHTITQPDDNEK
jgi:hypothetical protein